MNQVMCKNSNIKKNKNYYLLLFIINFIRKPRFNIEFLIQMSEFN